MVRAKQNRRSPAIDKKSLRPKPSLRFPVTEKNDWFEVRQFHARYAKGTLSRKQWMVV